MRSKAFAGILCILLMFCTALHPLRCSAASAAQELREGILAHQLAENGADSVQDWINGGLAAEAGMTAEWYILALSQSGENYDFSAYTDALDAYLSENSITSASTRQKYALAYLCVGGGDAYIAETMGNSIGQQGIMSWVYGLHLLNNGCTSSQYSAQDIVQTLLSLQLADGGWALTGENADVDVTAMTLQALAPYYAEHPAEIDRALALLSERQLENGDFASYGVPNPESTAQVMVALSALGIDSLTDERFVKNGNTLLDGMAKYRLAGGNFSHTEGGAENINATVQVFFALTALEGDRNMYLFTAPEGTAETADYRVIATLCILGAGGIVCLVLFLIKKRHPKNFLAVLVVTAVGIALVWFVQIESAKDYYRSESPADAEIIGTVTLTIRCDTVIAKSDAEHIPADGVILETAEFPLSEGDTVFDLLTQAAQTHSIQMEYSGTPELAYVQGIGNLYEFDFGDLSGWVYHVNGASSSVGCGEYVLSDGDDVEWLYTLDLGNDVAFSDKGAAP